MTEEFWADKFDRLRSEGDPLAALRVAMQHAAYPASVRDARVCIRDAVRADRKAKVQRKDTLSVLWKLGVYDCFMYSRGIVTLNHLAGPEQGQTYPAFNAIEACAHLRPWDRLTFDYDSIGYLKAGFLKTECKWFAEAWGEPREHRDPAEVDAAIWQEIVNNYSLVRGRQAAENARINALMLQGKLTKKDLDAYTKRRYAHLEVVDTEQGFTAKPKVHTTSSGWWTGLITPLNLQNRGLPRANRLGDGSEQK